MTVTRSLTFAIPFMLWVMLVLAAYYVTQPPLTCEDATQRLLTCKNVVELQGLSRFAEAFQRPPSLFAVFQTLWSLLAAMAISATAALFGYALSPLRSDGTALMSKKCAPRSRWICNPLPRESRMERLESWLFAVGIGFGALSVASLALGLAGWIGVAPVVFALLLLITARHALPMLWRDLSLLGTVRLPPLLTAFILINIVLALLTALAPPTAWDALVYHLTVPRRALEIGRLAPTGDIIPHEHFPLFMSSLYLAAMTLAGDIAAQLLHFVFALMLLGLIAIVARRYYSPAALPFALGLTLSMPMVLLLATWAYNDLALAFYTLASVHAFRRWREQKTDSYLVVSALMAGFSMGLKYTSFVLPLGIVALMVWQERQRAVQSVIQFTVISAIAALPWYLKNLLFSGNPIYPFLFGGVHWDALRTTWYAQAGTGIGLDPLALLTLPLAMTLGIRDASFDGRMGPLILIGLPLLLFSRLRRTEGARDLRVPDPFVLLFLLFWAFWIIGVIGSSALRQTRLLLPALVLVVPALAQAVVNLSQFDLPTFSLRRTTTLIIGLVLGVTLFSQAMDFAKQNPLAYLVGAESREQFLVRQWGDHARAMFALNQLPATARVQFMWEPRSYYAMRPARADPLLDALPHLVSVSGDLDAAVQRLKADGFTHVLIFEAGARFAFDNQINQYTPADAENLRRLRSAHARTVYENGSYRLLELK